MTTIQIKPITKADAALLSEVAVKAYCDHYLHLWYDGGKWYLNRCFTEEVLSSELADTNNLFFITYLNNEAVGFLKIKIDSLLDSEPDKNAIELERIYLTKTASGKGIGKKLVELSFSIAKEYNKQLIWLKAMDTSTGPIAFYQQMGFELCGTYHLDFEQMKEELRGMVIMKKEL
ncbi:MAG: GNAT family N-acetyltransferase [Sphingobacteriales bacterium]|nr:GNAT family N-acetyltransferase [Sphingobacteriales bacterium]MBI3718515.1 GNAT family N-acetyltransferase [Sphingobacteriales bacterium]